MPAIPKIGVKFVLIFDSFQAAYLNYTEIRAYLYMYLIDNGVNICVLGTKCASIWPQPWLCQNHSQTILNFCSVMYEIMQCHEGI